MPRGARVAGQGLQRRKILRVIGWSLHETGTCRMGNDPKHFVTNRFGQTHDVPNLYVCDASVFPNSTDKTTTISILTFSLRTSEYLLQNFNQRVHRRA
jgi:choline dehydrogenase-like flavoprotein